jgi:murein DD-endopeptidase MepM/ murein hydrolase activator NlpD
MKYIQSYDNFENIDESIKDSFIIGVISMMLLNSCSVSKNMYKNDIPVEISDKNMKHFNNSYVLSKVFSDNKSKLPWPVKCGEIINKFGIQKCDNQKCVKINNQGIEIRTISNLEIHPIFDGVVSKIFDVCGEKTIIIRHNNYYSVYSGFNKISKNIKINHKVNIHSILGYSKNIIEIQIWKNSKNRPIALNPIEYLSKS